MSLDTKRHKVDRHLTNAVHTLPLHACNASRGKNRSSKLSTTDDDVQQYSIAYHIFS